MLSPLVNDNNESKLGTKDYWENHYKREIANFEAIGDDGEIWFGERSEQRILRFILENLPDRRATPIVELGCGNASLLRKLVRIMKQICHDYYTQLCGLDYSLKALELSRRLCDKENEDHAEAAELITPEFHLIDLTAANAVGPSSVLTNRFDCIIDKGTFDAISLAPGSAEEKVVRVHNYRQAVQRLARHGKLESAFFIIVSCNFTREELVKTFECDALTFHAELPNTGTFTFGGQSGATFSGIVFRLKRV